jgi:hypothetical protein
MGIRCNFYTTRFDNFHLTMRQEDGAVAPIRSICWSLWSRLHGNLLGFIKLFSLTELTLINGSNSRRSHEECLTQFCAMHDIDGCN